MPQFSASVSPPVNVCAHCIITLNHCVYGHGPTRLLSVLGHSAATGRYVLKIPIDATIAIHPGLKGPLALEFLNSASGRTCMFTGVHHWSWSGLNMFVYLADGVTADTFNDAFNVGDTLRVRQTADWDRPVKRLFKNKNSNAPAYLNRSVTSSTPGSSLTVASTFTMLC